MSLFSVRSKLGTITCNEFVEKDYSVFKEYYNNRKVESFNCNSMFHFYLSKKNEGCKPKSWIKSVWFEYEGYLCIVDICKRSSYLSDYPFDKNGEPMPLDLLEKLFYDASLKKKIINVPPCVVDCFGRDLINSFGYKLIVDSIFGLDHIDDNNIIKENKGKKLANLRHTSRRFERLYPNVEVIEYDGTDDSYEMFRDIYEYWENNEGSKYNDIFDKDCYFVLLKHWDKVCYRAFAFKNRDNDELIGMTSYFVLNKDVAYCFARKFKNEYIGSADYSQIYISTRMLEDGIKYCHNGNDGGEGPLRFFKNKMDSVFLNKSYILKKI